MKSESLGWLTLITHQRAICMAATFYRVLRCGTCKKRTCRNFDVRDSSARLASCRSRSSQSVFIHVSSRDFVDAVSLTSWWDATVLRKTYRNCVRVNGLISRVIYGVIYDLFLCWAGGGKLFHGYMLERCFLMRVGFLATRVAHCITFKIQLKFLERANPESLSNVSDFKSM